MASLPCLAGVSLGGGRPTGPPSWPEGPGPLSPSDLGVAGPEGHASAQLCSFGASRGRHFHLFQLLEAAHSLACGPSPAVHDLLLSHLLPAFLSCGPGGDAGPIWITGVTSPLPYLITSAESLLPCESPACLAGLGAGHRLAAPAGAPGKWCHLQLPSRPCIGHGPYLPCLLPSPGELGSQALVA